MSSMRLLITISAWVATVLAGPMRGWMTWERYTCETDCTRFPETCISERLIKTTADAMEAGGFVEAGYTYIQIDDCWAAKERDPKTGTIVPDPARFPSGLKDLSQYVRSKGLKLGLYGDIGTHTCGGYPGFNVSATTDPIADGMLAADAAAMASWGIASLKVDGCFADTKMMNVTYPKLASALAAAAAKSGTPEPWYSCSWPDYVADGECDHKRTEPCVPLHAIAKTCDSARLWMDISDSWNQPVENGAGVKNYIDFWRANPQLADLRNTLPAGTSYYNDPDQLLIGSPGLSRTEAEVQMGMWALWSAPMILSVELRNGSISEEMRSILLNTEVLAVSDDPLGRQATECTSSNCHTASVLYEGATSIWNKTLHDGTVAIGLVNTGNFGNIGTAFGDFNISFTAAAVGLPCDTFEVRDLFQRKDLGTYSGGFWAEVDESSMRLLKLSCNHQAAPAKSRSQQPQFSTSSGLTRAPSEDVLDSECAASLARVRAELVEAKAALDKTRAELAVMQSRTRK
eukprot:m.18351 g.18351  ORF g.18351 m.18351 type:complete len:516 (+) comp5306_c0_seq1:193-1740(+)